jgi:hypothetical protein
MRGIKEIEPKRRRLAGSVSGPPAFSSCSASQFTVSVTEPTVAVTEADDPLDVPVPVTVSV